MENIIRMIQHNSGDINLLGRLQHWDNKLTSMVKDSTRELQTSKRDNESYKFA